MTDTEETSKSAGPGLPVEATVGPNLRCMYCDGTNGEWEILETNAPLLGDEEIWFCCHTCRDAGQPCETFHPLPDSWKRTPPNAQVKPASCQETKRDE